MEFLVESMCPHIGRTVTIFTTSGGLSGVGFTGVLVSVTRCSVRLITGIGAPPACPLGSDCTGPIGDVYGEGGNCGSGSFCGYGNNWLGSITEIPTASIASFTHNAI